MNAMKKTGAWRKVLALTLGLLGLGAAARAAASDSLTVTITPNAGYSVVIATDDVHMNLGLVDLNTSTAAVRPSTVTIQSSFAATDLKLQGQITSAGTPWTFASNTASQGADQLATWAVFTDTGVAAIPAQSGGYFSGTQPGVNGSDVVDGTLRDVGTNGATTLFVAASGEAGYKTMEDMPNNLADLPASQSHLWLRFRLPPSTTDGTAKNITITLTAGAPN